MGPNSELSCAVEQFHLLCLNCHWHSAMPALAPLPTPLMWSWYSWHNFVWPGESPLIWVHNGEAPIRYWGCGSLTTSAVCTPTFLEPQRKKVSQRRSHPRSLKDHFALWTNLTYEIFSHFNINESVRRRSRLFVRAFDFPNYRINFDDFHINFCGLFNETVSNSDHVCRRLMDAA